MTNKTSPKSLGFLPSRTLPRLQGAAGGKRRPWTTRPQTGRQTQLIGRLAAGEGRVSMRATSCAAPRRRCRTSRRQLRVSLAGDRRTDWMANVPHVQPQLMPPATTRPQEHFCRRRVSKPPPQQGGCESLGVLPLSQRAPISQTLPGFSIVPIACRKSRVSSPPLGASDGGPAV